MSERLRQSEAREFSVATGAVGRHQVDTRNRFDKVLDGTLDAGNFTVNTTAKVSGAIIGTGIRGVRSFIETLTRHAKR